MQSGDPGPQEIRQDVPQPPAPEPSPPPAGVRELQQLEQLTLAAVGKADAAGAATAAVRAEFQADIDGIDDDLAALEQEVASLRKAGPSASRWSDLLDRVTSRKFLLALGSEVALVGAALTHAINTQTGFTLATVPVVAYIVIEGAADLIGRMGSDAGDGQQQG